MCTVPGARCSIIDVRCRPRGCQSGALRAEQALHLGRLRQAEPAGAVHQQAVALAQLAGHDVHHRHIAAVAVEDQQLLHTRPRHAGAQLGSTGDHRGGRQSVSVPEKCTGARCSGQCLFAAARTAQAHGPPGGAGPRRSHLAAAWHPPTAAGAGRAALPPPRAAPPPAARPGQALRSAAKSRVEKVGPERDEKVVQFSHDRLPYAANV